MSLTLFLFSSINNKMQIKATVNVITAAFFIINQEDSHEEEERAQIP